MSDFDTSHLSGKAKKIADAIVTLLTRENGGEAPYGGGCKAFYSPAEWKARQESYGLTSVLILCHDGGDLADYCNEDYERYSRVTALNKTLDSMGYYMESCTGWYTAIYPK